MPVNVRVEKRRGETDEKLVRRFIRKCKKLKIVEQYRARTDHYVKPSVARRLKKEKARREHLKQQKKKRNNLFR
jgi:ribosomal protein S21